MSSPRNVQVGKRGDCSRAGDLHVASRFFNALPLRVPFFRLQSPRTLTRLLFLLLACAPFFPLRAEVATERPLIAGAASDAFPNSFVGAEGRCEGFAVDLLDAVARVMDLSLERVVAPSAELHARFEAGEFDFLQAYTPGPGRERFADFSAHYMSLQGAVFVRRDDKRLRTASDLVHARMLIVGRGSVGQKFLADHDITPASLTYTSSVREALHLIAAGEHDAVFASRLTALSVMERDRLKNIRTLAQPIEGYDVRHSFAVHAGDAQLLARLNEGLAILHRTGEFDKIYLKWYGHFDAPLFTREQVLTYAAIIFAIVAGGAMWGFLRQRALRRRLAASTASLQQKEALLAEAQQIAQVGHWSYDSATRDIECSAEALRILDQSADARLSYPRLLLRLPASDRSSVHRALRQSILAGAGCEFTTTLLPRGGGKKIIHATVRTLRDADGQVLRLFGTVQDVTRLITAEETLRARDQLLLAFYENIPSGMGVVEAADDSLRFVSANPGTARLLGLDNTPLAGRRLDELGLPAPVVDFWTALFHEANRSPENLHLERHLAYSSRHYSIIFVPLGGAGVEARPQVCYLIDDITERKQIDAEVAQSRRLRAIGELVGGIAHEFNNLLTPVLLKTSLLAEQVRSQPALVEELRVIARAAQRGADLTKRLLAFSRRSEAKNERVELPALVKSNFDLVRTTIDRRIELASDLAPELPPLFLNATDLHQIFLNLVLNARDTLMEKLEHPPASTWHPRILVSAAHFDAGPASLPVDPNRRIHGWIRLSVQDNGLGMSREVQERIFEPFYTTKGMAKGTGLGLATVWHLVGRLGGKITVSSVVGEGSTFQVWLPVIPVPTSGASGDDASGASNVFKNKILLVEDDDLVAQTLITALRRLGHEVAHLSHGAEAWRHLSNRPTYDIVMLDLDLPGMSGLEIARRLRESRFPGKLLIASGRLAEHELNELRALKVDHILEKPFSPQTLQFALHACRTRIA